MRNLTPWFAQLCRMRCPHSAWAHMEHAGKGGRHFFLFESLLGRYVPVSFQARDEVTDFFPCRPLLGQRLKRYHHGPKLQNTGSRQRQGETQKSEMQQQIKGFCFFRARGHGLRRSRVDLVESLVRPFEHCPQRALLVRATVRRP